jgi:hypothetical protein
VPFVTELLLCFVFLTFPFSEEEPLQVSLLRQLVDHSMRMADQSMRIADHSMRMAEGIEQMSKEQLAQKHRYTTSQATQFRLPGFRDSLLDAYGCRHASDSSMVRCMLTNDYYQKDFVCASHLFKYSWSSDVQATLGFTNINDIRNGLVLLK